MRPDLRMVPAGVTAWAVAAGALFAADHLGRMGLIRVLVSLVSCAAALGLARYRLASTPRRSRRHGATPDPAAQPDPGTHRARRRTRRPSRPEAENVPAGTFLAQLIVCLGVSIAMILSVVVQLGERETGGFAQAATGSATVTLRGTAVGPPKPAGVEKRWDATLELRATAMETDGEITTVRALVVVLGQTLHVRRGDELVVTGRLAVLPASSDAAALLLDGTVVERAPPTGPLAGIDAARSRFLDLTEPLSPQGRALVPGVAVGDDTRIEDTLEAAMRRTSLGHLTAVSGSHVSLVVAVLAIALGRLVRHARVIAAGLGLGALVMLVGPEPSVVRAAAMASVAFLAMALGRPPQAVPCLAGGLTLAILLDPWLALQFGFALSAAATAAILLLTMPFTEALVGPGASKRRTALGMAVAVPLAAGLSCAPILVLFNPEVSLVGVLANALVTPVVAPSTVFGLLGVILAIPLPAAAVVSAHIAEWCTWWIAAVALACARLPLAAVPWPGGAWGALLLLVSNGAIVVLLLALRRRREAAQSHDDAGPLNLRRWVATLATVFVLLAALAAVVHLRTPPWVVWQCDVGQGSGLLVRSGAGRAIMLDLGPSDGRSQDCLTRAGVRHLDLLVLTHPHVDHVGNLAAVLASVPVDRILVSPADDPAETVAWVEKEAAAVGRQAEVAHAGDHGVAGDVPWEVLWPPTHGAPPGTNDLSLVVLLHPDDGPSTLVLGDLESDGQRGLTRTLRSAGRAHVDVITVAHHGAAEQSRALAELLAPDVALVSVGENTYGHPASETIDLYEEVGAVVHRTDDLGDIVIREGGSWDAGSHGDHVGQSLPPSLRAGEGNRGRVRRSCHRPPAWTGARA